ncbi:MAG: hypothetical protein L3K19_01010 [Thermoplasmata archaeon]|nr:hypothetical protein [Thermoplasmata archaeon]
MVRTAQERISDLFALAEQEAVRGHHGLADRYVGLARRIGMRYNVRLPMEYRELYCRRCSVHWVEGRTVRTRLRSRRRVRTCLQCGWVRRAWVTGRGSSPSAPSAGRRPADQAELGLTAEAIPADSGTGGAGVDEGEEEE